MIIVKLYNCNKKIGEQLELQQPWMGSFILELFAINEK